MGFRYFDEPVSVITAIGAIVGTVAGVTERREAKDLRRAQAEQERIARDRELDDLETERRRTLARTRAALAAQGADTTSGSALAILTAQDLQFQESKRRLTADSAVTIGALQSRANSEGRVGALEAIERVAGAGATLIDFQRSNQRLNRTPITAAP